MQDFLAGKIRAFEFADKVKGVQRSSEFENVDALIGERTEELMESDQWRYLRLRMLVKKVRFDAD